jgi:hypothetical protein
MANPSPTLLDPSAAWLSVDCDQCGAEMGQPCRSRSCGDSACPSVVCGVFRKLFACGGAYCGGGSRARAELGITESE